jgi:cell division protein FtsW
MDLVRRRSGPPKAPTRSDRSLGADRRRAGPAGSTTGPNPRTSAASVASDARPAARTKADVLQRDRHQPDYAILVAVVALAAIGILMVYSSSAIRSYIERDDTLAIVGPQILWAAIGLLVLFAVMRIDYRVLRLASVPAYVVAVVLLVLVFIPQLNRVVGGSARWLVIGPLPAVHPAEIAKLALIVYLAHWLANRGKLVGSFRMGTVPFLLITAPIALLVFREPDLGTTAVIGLTAFTMFYVAGASLWQFGAIGLIGVAGTLLVGLRGYQADRIKAFLDPWADPLGAGFHTIQGLLALGLGGILGSGLGESKLAGGLYLPNAWNDFNFAIIGEEFGFIGAGTVIVLFLVLAWAGIRTALRAPDTFGALLAAGITAWLCLQAFINIAVVVALLPVTGITLPFISAGGSSLVVSFAAVGVLLSISRETLEPGEQRTEQRTQQRTELRTDASADRGRGHGGTHLPGSRRRELAASPRQRR